MKNKNPGEKITKWRHPLKDDSGIMVRNNRFEKNDRKKSGTNKEDGGERPGATAERELSTRGGLFLNAHFVYIASTDGGRVEPPRVTFPRHYRR